MPDTFDLQVKNAELSPAARRAGKGAGAARPVADQWLAVVPTGAGSRSADPVPDPRGYAARPAGTDRHEGRAERDKALEKATRAKNAKIDAEPAAENERFARLRAEEERDRLRAALERASKQPSQMDRVLAEF